MSTAITSRRCSGVDEYGSRRPASARPRRPQADVVHGLSPRRRPRRHAQRDLDPLHRRLRRAHGAEDRRARRQTQFAGRVDGVYAFTHPFGCSQLGDDLDAHPPDARRARQPSQCRRRADPRPRLRDQPARPLLAGDGGVDRARLRALHRPGRGRRDRGGPGAGRRAGRDRRSGPSASPARCPTWSSD